MSQQRIALFAADEVGLAVAQVFVRHQCAPCALVLDARDPKSVNVKIESLFPSLPAIKAEKRWDETAFEWLSQQDIDLGILAWWPFLVPEAVLKSARLGFLNFHPSLLPYNRGKNPNFWSLVEGTPFGVSLHFADKGVDSGDIAFSEELEVTWEDTGQTLYERAKTAILALFEKYFHQIVSGQIPRRPQNLETGTFHLGAQLELASTIDLDQAYRARDLLNLLRARTFPPHPGVSFEEGGQRYEVRVSIQKVGSRDGPSG